MIFPFEFRLEKPKSICKSVKNHVVGAMENLYRSLKNEKIIMESHGIYIFTSFMNPVKTGPPINNNEQQWKTDGND